MKLFLIISAIALSLIASVVPAPGTDAWYPQFVAVMFFGFLLFAHNLSKMSKPLAILFAYITFSAIFICHQNVMSLMSLIQTALCLGMAQYISQLNQVQRVRVWITIGCLLVLQIFWGVLQVLNLDPFFHLINHPGESDTVGFSGSHNQYGLFLASASPVALIFPWTIPILFIAIVLSKTFTALLGLFGALIFLFRKKINFKIFGVVVIACAISIFIFLSITHKGLEAKYKERSDLWKHTASQILGGKAILDIDDHTKRIITCNPAFGFGFGSFIAISPYTQKDVVTKGMSHRYEHAHNDYVEALFDLGIIGFLLVCWVIFDLICKYVRVRVKTKMLDMSTAGLIAFSICALAIYTIHTAYSAMFLCVLLGLFYAEVKKNGA